MVANSSFNNSYRQSSSGDNFGFSICSRGCCIDYFNGPFLCQKESLEEAQRCVCDNANLLFLSIIKTVQLIAIFLLLQRKGNWGLLWLLLTSPSLIFHMRPLRRPQITLTNPINWDKEVPVQFIKYDSFCCLKNTRNFRNLN